MSESGISAGNARSESKMHSEKIENEDPLCVCGHPLSHHLKWIGCTEIAWLNRTLFDLDYDLCSCDEFKAVKEGTINHEAITEPQAAASES